MLDQYDVIIAGSGVAGLYTALNLSPSLRVLVLCKQEMLLTNTALAQGGVAAVLDLTDDSFDLHFEDTMIAGGYKNNPQAVRTLVEEGPDDVRRIYEMGVEFDKGPDGRLSSTLEGGHSRNRIVHHRDSTGRAIAECLAHQVQNRDNIDVAEFTTLFRLERVSGGFLVHVLTEGRAATLTSSFVVLATGGIGRIYKYTTNSKIATGDGIRLAYELGCRIEHLDYVQFHPTAFAAAPARERFLISEAVRGEGAYLLNCYRDRFMDRYDSRLELAPRDVVSKSIILESRRCGSEQFYLDITHKPSAFLKDRFPMIYARCLEEGVDITKDCIPVYPCQHYLMGGIDVELNARNDLDRLYAVGECSHTGVHGANRLASNSLLEALVFGRRAAQDIMGRTASFGRCPTVPSETIDTSGAPLPHGLADRIHDIMQQAYFVLPDYDAARRGLSQATAIRERLLAGGFAITQTYCERLSIATAAAIILRELIKK